MPSINLTAQRLAQLDPTDMLGKTLELAGTTASGRGAGRPVLRAVQFSAEPLLDWCGLGGSAVAGDLLQAFGLEPPGWMRGFSCGAGSALPPFPAWSAAIRAILWNRCML